MGQCTKRDSIQSINGIHCEQGELHRGFSNRAKVDAKPREPSETPKGNVNERYIRKPNAIRYASSYLVHSIMLFRLDTLLLTDVPSSSPLDSYGSSGSSSEPFFGAIMDVLFLPLVGFAGANRSGGEVLLSLAAAADPRLLEVCCAVMLELSALSRASFVSDVGEEVVKS